MESRNQIERAVPADFEAVLELYRLATVFHQGIGLVQWDDEYPSAETLKENLEEGTAWVIWKGTQVVATTTLDDYQDPQYEGIQWAYPSDRVLVVHRLCVHPSLQGQGFAKRLMYFAEKYARELKYEVIRLDAFLGNDSSQRLYHSLNYHEAIGYCYYPPNQIMCNCFEKQVF